MVCSQRLKSWQIHHFKWTNKTTQIERRQQITRKFLAKREKRPKELKSLLISAGFTINTIRLDMDGAISMTGMIEPFMIVTAYA